MATPQLGNSLPSPELGWTRKFCNKSNVGTFFKNIRVVNNNFYASWMYIGDDAKPTEESSWYNVSSIRGSDDDIFSFEFTGTSFRILQKYYTSNRRNIRVRIDNGIWMDGSVIRANYSKFRVCFEKLDLPRGTHKVEVIPYGFTAGSIDSDNNTMISAIDYADFSTQVGDKLTKPELGWQRHRFNEKLNDGTEAIKFYPDNIWKAYQEEYIYSTSPTVGYIRFKFYGSAIRIISTHFGDTATNAKITIDGKASYYTSKGSADGDRLSFEQYGLSLGIHTVEIDTNSTGKLSLSAIDLKDGEYLVPLIKVGDVLLQPEAGWKRFDDTDSNIKYVGNTWQSENSTSAGYYKNTLHFKHSNFGSEAIKIQFSFIGSRLRIIALSMSSYDRYATIKIDDKPYNLSYYNKEPTKQCLIFEELNLEYGSHTVSIEGLYLNLDAIDIDADGSLFTPAKVGDVLTQPEPGWKRFDDTDPLISYAGPWYVSTNTPLGNYNKTLHSKDTSNSTAAEFEFTFKGTGIRLISTLSPTPTYYVDSTITIDGVSETFKGYYPTYTLQGLAFQKLNLKNGVHTVKVSTPAFIFDAVDIQNGNLFTPTQIGDVLKEPESGWKRFDDRDPNILYQGNWIENENITTHYRGTFHNKPSSSGDDSIVKALFDFSGTKIRIIAFMTTGSYDVGTIKIDGETFNFSYIKGTPTAQCLVFEKAGLETGVHKVELSGRYINLDAIDIDDTGELIPIKIDKPKVSLYEKESGKVFVDDFDSINPKWLMSPFTAFNNVAKPGFLRMNHSADKDVLLLIDKPQGNVAIQVIADYTPTKEGDKGGLLIYKNEANNIEFLESMKVSNSPDPKEWLAVCKENQWDFYNKTDVTFDYVRSEQLEAHKIGVVLKKGSAEGFTPLDINKIIITTSNLLRLRQLYEKYKIVLKDAAENVISTSFVESANTGIDIPLPSLEFEGIVEIYDEDGTLVAKRQTTFFGGDMYCMGSSLHISMDTKELDETDPTHLGYMTEIERLVKMTLTNDNVGPVSNVKVAIQQYMEKFGYTWAHLSLDGSHYTDELAIETLDAGSSKDFWVKIIKDVNYMAFEPIYFNIHLSHE